MGTAAPLARGGTGPGGCRVVCPCGTRRPAARRPPWIRQPTFPREREVVRLVLRSMANRQIAGELLRSPSTVGDQLKSAMRKYGVSSRTALAVIVSQADGE
ncbi:response regulator transcription factor [Streptomyces sp. NPDC056161]|uniref:response regulator transcription factor n=1 Tax=Streptomyces sp. NPDC056161 TaxID=3345732 RepID=UPI0035E30892